MPQPVLFFRRTTGETDAMLERVSLGSSMVGSSDNTWRRHAFAVMVTLVSIVAWLAYRRGLTGVFLFDDFANLPNLGAYGPVDNWTVFLRYITSGNADPTGRPLALLSFLVDAHNWPADPYPFKRSNVLLHLLNGALLAVLLRRLGLFTGRMSGLRNDVAAVLGAAMWLLHPLLVSTTLYVVQREAMLPTTFTLLGLIALCRARVLAAQGRMSG